MKKLTLTSAVVMALAATGAFAHHPSEGISPNFDQVTENLEAANSPHLTMEIDNMGSAAGIDAGSSGMEQAERALSGWNASQNRSGVEPPMEPVTDVETMILLEDVTQ